MQTDHPTASVAQTATDNYLVFQRYHGTPSLVQQVEIPQYSQPDDSGVTLSRDKRLSLAVARAIEHGKPVREPVEGERFHVLTELGADEFETVEYEQNPAFEAVWDPEQSEGSHDSGS